MPSQVHGRLKLLFPPQDTQRSFAAGHSWTLLAEVRRGLSKRKETANRQEDDLCSRVFIGVSV